MGHQMHVGEKILRNTELQTPKGGMHKLNGGLAGGG